MAPFMRTSPARATAAATAVRVYDHGMSLGREGRGPIPVEGEPVLVLESPGDIKSLRDALEVSGTVKGRCRCLGDVTFEFLGPRGEQQTVVVLHHAKMLEWDDWESGMGLLADPDALLALLAAHGFNEPRDKEASDQVYRQEQVAQHNDWLDATPECVRDLLPQIMEDAAIGWLTVDGTVITRIHTAYPDPAERAKVLLRWYAAGSGRCTGYPTYEAIPAMMLTLTELWAFKHALRDETAGSPLWRGAARHLAGSRSVSLEDLLDLPADMWDTAMATAESIGDLDMLTRLKFKRDAITRAKVDPSA